MNKEIKEAIEYFNGWEEGDNITITSDFIMNAEVLKELEEVRQRLIKFLYQEYDKDTTCVEVNELLDILEEREDKDED